MFSNQKKRFFKSKWFYGIIIMLLLIFGLWMNYDGNSQKTNTTAKAGQETKAGEQPPAVVDSLHQDTSEKNDSGSSEQSEDKQQPYYLIQEIEGVVKVFYCDENGRESLYQITSVPFHLMSQEDQQMLTEGVHVNSEDELADFLENFDS